MFVIVVSALFLGSTSTTTQDSGAAGAATPLALSPSAELVARVSAPERCPRARKGLAFYRGKYNSHRAKMGAREVRGLSTDTTIRACPRVRDMVHVWKARAYVARETAKTVLALRAAKMLHDFVVRDGNHAWLRAVDEAQKVFPGSRAWLRSCSAPTSEGGWGRWVSYQGKYTPEYAAEHYIVGGWLQFKLPTFKGFFRHALDDVRKAGLRIPPALRSASDVEAWQSPLAQALAGGWAYRNGQTGHWVGSGC